VSALGEYQLMQRAQQIRAEADRLNALKSLTNKQEQRLAELVDDAKVVGDRLDEIARASELEKVRGLVGGGGLVAGDGTVRADGTSYTSRTSTDGSSPERSAALRTLERLHTDGKLPDDAAERASKLVTDGTSISQTIAANSCIA
jgi:hypothetical protein